MKDHWKILLGAERLMLMPEGKSLLQQMGINETYPQRIRFYVIAPCGVS